MQTMYVCSYDHDSQIMMFTVIYRAQGKLSDENMSGNFNWRESKQRGSDSFTGVMRILARQNISCLQIYFVLALSMLMHHHDIVVYGRKD